MPIQNQNDATPRDRLIQRFRSEHADFIPVEILNLSKAEFLDQCVVVFQCTACGSAFHFKDAESHGTECTRSSPNPWSIESSTPARHSIIEIASCLLEILKLPLGATLSSATEALKDVPFACLCGDPRYEGNFDFQGILDHVIFENQEHEEIKSKILGKTRSSVADKPALFDTRLINDHNSYALKSNIVRIDREGGYGDMVRGFATQPQRIPTRRKWDHCNICLQLTGTKVYFGGNPEFKRYHLSARHGRDLP